MAVLTFRNEDGEQCGERTQHADQCIAGGARRAAWIRIAATPVPAQVEGSSNRASKIAICFSWRFLSVGGGLLWCGGLKDRCAGARPLGLSAVMAGLVPAIHAVGTRTVAWMPGTRPGMTGASLSVGDVRVHQPAKLPFSSRPP